MRYEKMIDLKNGQRCLLRNGEASDARELNEVFCRAHAETDYLLTYPEESTFSEEEEARFLSQKIESPREIEICAFVDGVMVGSAGIEMIRDREKTRHRADFGISILKDYWGLGIGRALTQACISCAKQAGYAQLELEVVADNTSAAALYKSEGFTEYGRNPRGFRSRITGWQEIVLMRLEL